MIKKYSIILHWSLEDNTFVAKVPGRSTLIVQFNESWINIMNRVSIYVLFEET